jgi:hypothetical protein
VGKGCSCRCILWQVWVRGFAVMAGIVAADVAARQGTIPAAYNWLHSRSLSPSAQAGVWQRLIGSLCWGQTSSCVATNGLTWDFKLGGATNSAVGTSGCEHLWTLAGQLLGVSCGVVGSVAYAWQHSERTIARVCWTPMLIVSHSRLARRL